VVGSRAVTVHPKEFPEEHLTVASKYVAPPREVDERLARERARLREIYRQRTPVRSAQAPFVRPVPGEPTSTFGKRRIFNGEPRSPHPGLDLRAASGTPVVSSGPGRVLLAQDLYYSGNTVLVDHGGGLFTLYAHLSEIQVAEGDEVAAGEQVGLSGATGRVTGPHLHWGAKIGDRPFDPQALLDPALFGG
jgi:murein DD-endopeptidase MepM/ murein hydrolase activator NlpD